MADARLSSSSGKPTCFKKMGLPLLLMVLSTIIGILLIELLCRLFLPSIGSAQSLYKGIHRVVFLDGRGTIFRNYGDIFTYVPHNEIRNVTGSFSDGDFNVEYDYRFRTNNFGLVQDVDVVPDRKSLVLLGDSFTEGQGAEPWFRLISSEIDKLGYQAVNGGLLGTGFEQWLKLERYLTSKNVRIRRLVVVFISDDYNRSILNFKPNDLRCLRSLPLCQFEESLFYRLPPREELLSWVDKIRTARLPMIRKFTLEARAETLAPASFHVYKYLSERLRHPESTVRSNRAREQSRAAITELIRLYNPENVVFMHVPQKEEIDSGPNSLGLMARRSIEDAGGKLLDGFKLCQLTVSDYYSDDEHPNSNGYAKIARCVMSAVRVMVRVGAQ